MNKRAMSAQCLSVSECAALRGIAIAGIVLHNYCHWLGFAVKENEYTFNAANTAGLWRAMAAGGADLPVHLLSYFGHYGVPVFLFLSGYGLSMKYERGGHVPPALPFVRDHYAKLLRMMLPGFAAFAVFDAITPGAFHFHAEYIIAQLLMLINLAPHPSSVIWPGPYWFFGLMLQLYAVYRLALCRRGWRWAVAVALACWAAQAVCQPMGNALNCLRYNCVGGMGPFVAGLLAARYVPAGRVLAVGRKWWWALLACSLAVLLACCASFQAWLWAPLAATVATVAAVKALPAVALRPLSWLGGVSAAMFVVHPLLRKVFIPISRRGDVYDGLVLYAVATVAVAWMAMEVVKRQKGPKGGAAADAPACPKGGAGTQSAQQS